VPGGTRRNFASYGQDLILEDTSEFVRDLVCDPQTSGGLLVSVAQEAAKDVEAALLADGGKATPIGRVVAGSSGHLRVV